MFIKVIFLWLSMKTYWFALVCKIQITDVVRTEKDCNYKLALCSQSSQMVVLVVVQNAPCGLSSNSRL